MSERTELPAKTRKLTRHGVTCPQSSSETRRLAHEGF
jgi:hypothetical protein